MEYNKLIQQYIKGKKVKEIREEQSLKRKEKEVNRIH